jgi:AcrR family transcriptional regulator
MAQHDAGSATQPEPPASQTSRGRFRRQVRDDVKEVALRQLQVGGAQAVSVNAIAKELGVSGPALYRYFSSRDELLAELITDAYDDLAQAMGRAVEDSEAAPSARLWALAQAYRAWAVVQPHRYRLLFRAPVPGYDPYTEQLVTAAHRSMEVLLALLKDLPRRPRGARSEELRTQLDEWTRARDLEDVEPELAQRAVSLWARMHGLVSLEIDGNFASMGLDGESFYAAELEEVARSYVP